MPVTTHYSESTTIRLQVKGVSDTVKDDELKARFNSFGNVTDVHIAVDTLTNTRRGFAYVQMECTDASLKRCMSLLNGTRWKGRELHLALAKPRFISTLQKEVEQRQKEEAILQDEREREARGEIVHPVVAPITMGIKLAKKSHGWKLAGRQGRPVAVMKMYNPYKRRIIVMDPSENVRSAVRYHQPNQNNSNSLSMGLRNKFSKPLNETEETPEYLARIEKSMIDERRMLRSILEASRESAERNTPVTDAMVMDGSDTQTQIPNQPQSEKNTRQPKRIQLDVDTQKEKRDLRNAAAKACAKMIGEMDDIMDEENSEGYVSFDGLENATNTKENAVGTESECEVASITGRIQDKGDSNMGENTSDINLDSSMPAERKEDSVTTIELADGMNQTTQSICTDADVVDHKNVPENSSDEPTNSQAEDAGDVEVSPLDDIDMIFMKALTRKKDAGNVKINSFIHEESARQGSPHPVVDESAPKSIAIVNDSDVTDDGMRSGVTNSAQSSAAPEQLIALQITAQTVADDTSNTAVEVVASEAPTGVIVIDDDSEDNGAESEPELPAATELHTHENIEVASVPDNTDDRHVTDNEDPKTIGVDTECAISQVDGADDKRKSRASKHSTRPKRQNDRSHDKPMGEEGNAQTEKKKRANAKRLESLKALRETSKLAKPIKISADAPSNNKNKIRFGDSDEEDIGGEGADEEASASRKRKREKKQKKKDKAKAKANRAVAADFMGMGDGAESEEKESTTPAKKSKLRSQAQEKPKTSQLLGDSSDDSDSDSSDVPTRTLGLPGVDGSDGTDGDSDDDAGSDAERFAIKPVFEGKGGAELLELKRRYQGDERFQLDSRFIEDESSSSDSESEDEMDTTRDGNATDEIGEEVGTGMGNVVGVTKVELKAERGSNRKILESLLGVGVSKKHQQSDARDFEEGFGDDMESGHKSDDDDETLRNEKDINKKQFVDMRTMHYDPTNEDMTAMFDAKEEEAPTKKNKKGGDGEDDYDKPKVESAALPEVSKDKTFAVHIPAMADFFKMKEPESETPTRSDKGVSMTVGGVDIEDSEDEDEMEKDITSRDGKRIAETDRSGKTDFSFGDSFGFGFGAESDDEDEEDDVITDAHGTEPPVQAGSFSLGALLGVSTEYNPDDESSDAEDETGTTSPDSSDDGGDAIDTSDERSFRTSNDVIAAKVGDSAVVAGVNIATDPLLGARSLLFKWAVPSSATEDFADDKGVDTRVEDRTSTKEDVELPALFVRTDTLDVVKKRWMDRREQLTKEFKSKRKGNLRKIKKGGSNNYNRN